MNVRWLRWQLACITFAMLLAPAQAIRAQLNPAAPRASESYDATGVLQAGHWDRTTHTRYMLVDDQQNVLFHVKGPSQLIRPFLGKRVGIRGATSYFADAGVATTVLQQVDLLRGPSMLAPSAIAAAEPLQSVDSMVRQASFQQANLETPAPLENAPAAPYAPAEPYAPGAPCAPQAPPGCQPLPPPPPCTPGPRLWADFDYLLWGVKGMYVPALATTSPAGTPQALVGVLENPSTSILYGEDRINTGLRNGARAQFGTWLGPESLIGVGGEYYTLFEESDNFTVGSDFSAGPSGAQYLARPFFNTAPNVSAPSSLIVAMPNVVLPGGPTNLSGSITVDANSDVQSAAALLRGSLVRVPGNGMDLSVIGGYRFFKMDEGLTVQSTSLPSGGAFLPASSFTFLDQFDTHNTFHGGEIGLLDEIRYGAFALELCSRLAMGNMHEEVDVAGSSTVSNGINTTVTQTGFLAQPTNIGSRSRDQFALIPQAEVKIAARVFNGLRISAGYNFTYVTRLVRPGSQIDLAGTVGGRPAPWIAPADLWLQGLVAGVEARF